MTISEAFAQFEIEELHFKGRSEKTRLNYRGCLRSFLRANTDIPVQLLQHEHLVRWKLDMDRHGNAVSYIGHNIIRFRNVLMYLGKRGISTLDASQVEVPKITKKKVQFLYAREVRDMIEAMELPRDKALIAACFSSGGRINEVLQLNCDSIHKGRAQIVGKGDKPGTLYFDASALKYIEMYLSTRRDKLRPLFISSQRRRLGYARANQIFHEAADKAGIDINVSTHVLRHSFATDLLLNGAHIMEVKEQLRHEDISTTMRYLHITDEHNAQTHQKYHSSLE